MSINWPDIKSIALRGVKFDKSRSFPAPFFIYCSYFVNKFLPPPTFSSFFVPNFRVSVLDIIKPFRGLESMDLSNSQIDDRILYLPLYSISIILITILFTLNIPFLSHSHHYRPLISATI
jgi:hypothetical protein